MIDSKHTRLTKKEAQILKVIDEASGCTTSFITEWADFTDNTGSISYRVKKMEQHDLVVRETRETDGFDETRHFITPEGMDELREAEAEYNIVSKRELIHRINDLEQEVERLKQVQNTPV